MHIIHGIGLLDVQKGGMFVGQLRMVEQYFYNELEVLHGPY